MLSNKKIVCPDQLLKLAKTKGPIKVVIVNAGKAVSIESAKQAVDEGLIDPIFIGDQKIIKKLGNSILKKLEKNGCKIIGDDKIRKFYKGKVKKATTKDWSKEYLSSIVSVKTVKNLDEAIKHINKYGTMHTDCIITQNKKSAKKFLKEVKSSISMHNTSTKFADGGELGLVVK